MLIVKAYKIVPPANGNRYKRILLPTGIALFIFASLFGALKFSDTFYGPNANNPTLTSENSGKDSNASNLKRIEGGQPYEDTKQPAENSYRNPNNPAISKAGSDIWIVNKTRPLEPKHYQPSDLVFPNVPLRVPNNESMKVRSSIALAIKEMFTEAKSAGHDPMLSSGFRSFAYQVSLYNNYVSRYGQEEADKQSARPGYSEHQTGMAFDICNRDNCKLEQSFGTTPLGEWVANSAHRYGFTIRYKQDKQNITGYMYEPWHLRYVGKGLATDLYETGLTLEEYFKLPPAPEYK